MGRKSIERSEASCGTIIPAGLLVVCGVIYLATGGQSQMSFQGSFWA